MPLTYIPQLVSNAFESAVVRELSRVQADGFISHNVLLLNVRWRSNPNEHDIVVLTPRAAFTIDAKEYQQGYYRISGNGPLEWRERSPEFQSEDGDTRVLHGFANPLHVAWQKSQVLRGLVYKRFAALRDLSISSIVVVPDHAQVFREGDGSSPRVTAAEYDLRVLKLSEIVQFVEEQASQPGRKCELQEIQALFQSLQCNVERRFSDVSFAGIRLLRPLVRTEPGCPLSMNAYEGVHELSGLLVDVHLYRKWPWNGLTDSFLKRLRKRLRALQALTAVRVTRVTAELELPDVVVLAFRQFKGEALHELLARRGSLPPKLVGHLLQELAETVQELHSDGVVHLDLRPEHVLVGPDLETHRGKNHLIRGLTNPLIDDAQISTEVFGNGFDSSFCAPEMQCHNHPDRGKPQNDVFSLGRLGIYCLLGDSEYRRRVLDGPIEPHSELANLNRVLVRATQFRAALRYPDMRSMTAELAM